MKSVEDKNIILKLRIQMANAPNNGDDFIIPVKDYLSFINLYFYVMKNYCKLAYYSERKDLGRYIYLDRVIMKSFLDILQLHFDIG